MGVQLRRSAGWLTGVEVFGARRGADELIGIIEDVGLGQYLEQILPFDSVLDHAPRQPPHELTTEEVPLFQLDARLKLWPDIGP